MAASETSKPGFWLVVLRVCVCSPYVCRYNYSLSWLLCLNVCDSGVTWMTVGHLSLQVLSTSLCVVIVTCSLFTVCDSFLSREKNERGRESWNPRYVLRSYVRDKAAHTTPTGRWSQRGRWSNQNGRRDTMLSRLRRHTLPILVRVFPGTNTLDSEAKKET